MLTLNLTQEVENQIRQNAAERGLNAEIYLHSLILQALSQPMPTPIPAQTSREEFLRRWEARAAQAQPLDPSVSNEALTAPAFRREDIYEDDGR